MDIFLSLVGAFIIISVLKIQKRFFTKTYFSFGEILTGFDPDITLFSFILRLLIPFVITFLIVIFTRSLSYPFFLAPGLVASFLIVWPVLQDARFIPEYLQEKKKELYAIYFLFIALFTLLSHVGGIVGTKILAIENFTEFLPTWRGLIDNLWTLVIVSGLGTLLRLILLRLKNE